MNKFEYKIVEEFCFLTKEQLNNYGIEGWKLVSENIYKEFGVKNQKIRYIFKRQL